MGSHVTTHKAVHTDFMGNHVGKPTTIRRVKGQNNLPPVDRSKVPTGEGATIQAVMDWVGYDPDRAKRALTAEHSRRGRTKSGTRLTPRKGLMAKLELLLEGKP